MNSSAVRAGSSNPVIIAMDPSGEAIPMSKQDNYYRDPNSKKLNYFYFNSQAD